MAALTSSQMMVAAPVVAKAGAASKAKAVAPRRAGVVSFSAKLGVSNGTEQKTNAFYIWKSQGNKFFETFSFLPPMDDAQLMKQITYMIKNKYNPCVEFEFPDKSIAVAATLGMGMDSSCSSTFYSNRYWSMWKLPMYGATDADQVMAECKKCAKTFPNAFVRLVGFDAARQCQMVGFITHRPAGGEALPVNQRSVESN